MKTVMQAVLETRKLAADVAVHGVQPPRVGREGAARRRLFVVPPTAATAAVRPVPAYVVQPQLYLVSVPARAAYSHSASLGSRYRAPVSCDSHAA